VQANVALVWLVEPGQDAEQRRLTDAVGPDEADAFAGPQLKADVKKQRPGIKSTHKTRAAEEKHGVILQ
jgi:hypothetical protein